MIEEHFTEIKNKLNKYKGLCLYSSILLYERLQYNGIISEIKTGYIKCNNNYYFHIWIEYNNEIYDIYESQYVVYLPLKFSMSYNDKLIQTGYYEYMKDSFNFWSIFDNVNENNFEPNVKNTINELRNYYL